MKLTKRLSLLLITTLVVAGFYTTSANALSPTERDLLRANAPWWFASQSPCGSIAANTGPTMDGHTLPAAQGGTGFEDPLDEEGRVIFNDGSKGNHVAFAGSIPKDQR